MKIKNKSMQQSNSILTVGRNILDIESKGIALVRDNLDQSFVDAVSLLYNTQGTIIVTGIGKSGMIAKKIVATLQSTGLSSHFVHPVDAFHGDFGMIKSGDTIIVISNSGESGELITFLKVIKSSNFNNKILLISSNNKSSIATFADVVLQTHVTAENDDENAKFIPTTSITVSLSLADALIISLLKLKSFHVKDFYRNHPGGKIGEKLKMIVKTNF